MQPMFIKSTYLEIEVEKAAARRVSNSAYLAEPMYAPAYPAWAMEKQIAATVATGLRTELSCASLSTMASDTEDCDNMGEQGLNAECQSSDHDHTLAVVRMLSNRSVSTLTSCECDRQEMSGELARSQHKEHILLPSKEFTYSDVPKSKNFAESFSAAAAEEAPTTMMLRNIPNRYTQSDLIKELNSLGFEGSFDFLYAPPDFGKMHIVGFAFVNFVDAELAARFGLELEGYEFLKHQKKSAKKAARVSVAHLQGLQANIDHYEKSAVSVRGRSRRCGPIIMSELSKQ